MRIITVARQFGSGGRELGKRLADILGWDYYDKEIMQKLSESSGLDEGYISTVLTNNQLQTIPLSYNNTFAYIPNTPSDKTALLISQRKIIESIAQAGRNFIIVGRDADIILADRKPFRLFVCADFDARLARCMRREAKMEGPKLSEKEIARNIRKVDKERARASEMLTGKTWGDGSCFDLSVNTHGENIKPLAQLVADYALKWFDINEVISQQP